MLKYVIAAVVIALLWMVMFRWARPGGLRRRGRKGRQIGAPRPQELVKCSTCGIYLPMGTPCDCKEKT